MCLSICQKDKATIGTDDYCIAVVDSVEGNVLEVGGERYQF